MLYLNRIASGKGTHGIRTIKIIESITKSDAANKIRYPQQEEVVVKCCHH